MKNPVARRSSLVVCCLSLLATSNQLPATVFAEELPSQDALRFARADFLLRHQQTDQSLTEFGQLEKGSLEGSGVRLAIGKAFEQLYIKEKHRSDISFYTAPGPSKGTFHNTQASARVTLRKYDSDANSDQNGDNRGLQVNSSFSTEADGPNVLHTRLAADVDGFKDGHNDVRYRTLLAEFSTGSSHFAMGDSATYTSPYFLRASRFRGVNWLIRGADNEFQLVGGAYPVWLESRDQYIYPRTVWGIRDRMKFYDDRLRLGVNFVRTQDTEKIQTFDGANPSSRADPVFKPKDNSVVSLEQEIKVIDNIWFIKALEAYSYTNENTLVDRERSPEQFEKLHDTSYQVKSLFLGPFFRWRSEFERTEPDFRLLTDLPQGAVTSPKDVRADVERFNHFVEFAPIGPFNLNAEAGWAWNNLDNEANVERTRQSWFTGDLGIETPEKWPKPRLRATMFNTNSVPGSVFRPSKSKDYDLSSEISQRFGQVEASLFGNYQAQIPLKEQDPFDTTERWTVGARGSRQLLERLFFTTRWEYGKVSEYFNNTTRRSYPRFEQNSHLAIPLWSTASAGLGYTYTRGQFRNLSNTQMIATDGHIGSASFSWPYVSLSPDKHRKFTCAPALSYQISYFSDLLESRPLYLGNLRMSYESGQDWKVELMGEYRFDDDKHNSQVRTNASRVWLAWSSRWK